MKTKVILVRHGETQWNVQGRFLGSVDIPLNEKGRRQASYTKKALEQEQIDCISSSPMKRAYETGEIIRADRHLTIHTDDGLREICCGKWEGLLGSQVEERYPGQLRLWNNAPQELHMEGGDTFDEVSQRIFNTFWAIVNANRGKTILITSHMVCLTLLLLRFTGKDINQVWLVKPLGNGAINVVEVNEDDKVEITAWSDDSFIPPEDRKGSVAVAGRDETGFR